MKTKFIALIILVVAGLLVTVYCLSSSLSVKREYNQYINKATKNSEMDIPYVAATNFKKAFDIKAPTEEVFSLYLKEMKKLGEDYYLIALEDYLVRFPMSSKAYELNLKRLYDDENYKAVVELALEAKEKEIATDKIKQYYIDAYYQYKYVKVGFEEAYSFLGDTALVKYDGLYGYLDSEGDYLIAPYYKKASHFFGTSGAANDGKGFHMINALGFKIAVTSEKVETLSFLNNDNVLASKKGKFTYLKTDLIVPDEFQYDDATNFKNQVAAVCQNGKWALISPNGKNITKYIFDDVIRDEFNTCINNGIIFAKTEGKYYMYNAKGKKVCDVAFDDARAFVGTQPTAVKVNGKWGFVDAEGEFVIEPKYDDAKSFNCGLAPVCKDEVWNYIDTSDTIRISGDFENAKPFSANGIAVIKEGEVWNYIKLVTF